MESEEVPPIVDRLFIEKINEEFFRGEPSDEDFWKNQYQKLPVDKRCDLWWMRIMRYEHMIHGKFNAESVEMEVLFLINALRKKDSEYHKLLNCLIYRLRETPLQNTSISQLMFKKLQEQ